MAQSSSALKGKLMAGERGRPRGFDIDAALESALAVFWKHGFQDASLAELTQATGLSKPSLYAAFGDKEALYLKALERYIAMLVARHGAALNDEADGRSAVRGFLYSLAHMLADPAMPGGCFIINGTADSGGSSVPPAVEQALRAALLGTEGLLSGRLERALRDCDLPADADPAALAALFAALIAGLAVLAKSGAAEAKLRQAVDAAMLAWPKAQAPALH
jgi:AcrR family transcriptional regulator